MRATSSIAESRLHATTARTAIHECEYSKSMKKRLIYSSVLPLVFSLLTGSRMFGQERVFAHESFAYRGTFPLELQSIGNERSGWSGPWRQWLNFQPVYVDTHTINNPFGSGHANSNRASNAAGTPRASVRKLSQTLGSYGTRTTIEFAMMERFGSNQDGELGGIQLLHGGQPVAFVGRTPNSQGFFAIGKTWDAQSEALQLTSLRSSGKDELYRTHFFRVTLNARTASRPDPESQQPTATLESFDMYGLPVATPVSISLADSRFDEVALILDDCQVDELVIRNETQLDHSPIHYRPARPGRLADTIPFYWNGEYHIFYLRAVGKVPWEHIVSRDMIHWRELPTALTTDGLPESPDGQNMFTGSVVERDGKFHLYYTGWNPKNPSGREFVMHATSDNLVEWQKVHADILGPDGVQYSDRQERDFRDPFVWFDSNAKRYRMALCTGSETGMASSVDLVHWEFDKPLQSNYERLGTPECPDLFEINGTHYLLVSPTETQSTIARYAEQWQGPYRNCVGFAIDTPFLYAAKRLYDGKRHIVTGWIRDLEGESDSGVFLWGGTQSVPRELYVGSDKNKLQCRPIPEAVAEYSHLESSLASALSTSSVANGELGGSRYRWEGDWRFDKLGASISASHNGDGRVSRHEDHKHASRLVLDTPENYMLETKLTPAAGSKIALTVRSHGDMDSGRGYTLLMRQGYAELYSAHFKSGRAIDLPFGREISVRAFVQGSIVEFFVNDAYAFSCRAYDLKDGKLQFAVVEGDAKLHEIQIRTTVPPGK